MAVFNSQRGGPESFSSFVRGDQFFYRGQRGGPEKFGDSSSQIDGPSILVKNDASLDTLQECVLHTLHESRKKKFIVLNLDTNVLLSCTT